MRAHGIVMLAGVLLAGAATSAEERVVALRDVTAIQDNRGSARVLFRTGSFSWDERRILESAVLTVPYSGLAEDRVTELRICPVTAARGGGGDWTTPFDEELYARGELDLRHGSGVMTFDLTVAPRAILEEGMTADGFVLTAGAGRTGGLRAACTSHEFTRHPALT
jgi:hypothetical protein